MSVEKMPDYLDATKVILSKPCKRQKVLLWLQWSNNIAG